MKTNASLFLVALGLFAVGANAAESHFEAGVLVLPTYVVSVPRYQSFEKQLNANLREVRQQARKPLDVKMELPPPKVETHLPSVVLNLPDPKNQRVAKS